MILEKKPYISQLYQNYGENLISSGAALGTAFKDAQFYNFGDAAIRYDELSLARNAYKLTDDQINNVPWFNENLRQRIRQYRDSPILSVEELNKDYSLDGNLTWDAPTTKAQADLQVGWKRNELFRRDTLNRAEGGFFNRAGRFIAGAAASLLDPVETGINLLPIGKIVPVIRGIKTTTFGSRFAKGAFEGVVSQAVTRPFVAYQSGREQSSYGIAEVFQDLAFGAVLGGGVPAFGGAVSDFRFGRKVDRAVKEFKSRIPEEKVDFDITDEASINRAVDEIHGRSSGLVERDIDPEIMRASVGQVAEGRSVDVGEISILKSRMRLRDIEDSIRDFNAYRNFTKEEKIDLSPIKSDEKTVSYSGSIDAVKTDLKVDRSILPEGMNDPKEIMAQVSEVMKNFTPITRRVAKDGSSIFDYVIKERGNPVHVEVRERHLSPDNVERSIEIRRAKAGDKFSGYRNYEIPESRITNDEAREIVRKYAQRARQEASTANFDQEFSVKDKVVPADKQVQQEIDDLSASLELYDEEIGRDIANGKLSKAEIAAWEDANNQVKNAKKEGDVAKMAASCILGRL